MKEDYLWDRSGNDPEVERLEEMLSVFRHTAEIAPRSNVISFPMTRSYVRKPWVLAIAAGVASAAG